MRSIAAAAIIASLVFLTGAVELQTDFEPATVGAPQLEVTQVGEIEIPGESNDVTLMVHHGDRFYLGAPAEDGGLHCYSLPDYEHLWSVSLGTFYSGRQRLNEVSPHRLVFAADDRTVLALVDAFQSYGDFEGNLAAIDAASGEILSETAVPDAGDVHLARIGDIDAVITVGFVTIRVLSRDDLSTELLAYAEDLPKAKHSGGRFPVNTPAFGENVFDEQQECLFCALPAAAGVTRFDFRSKRGQVTINSKRVSFGTRPFSLVQLGEELAVLNNGSGELGFFDCRTLEKTGTMQSLRNGWLEKQGALILAFSNEAGLGPAEADMVLQIIDPDRGEVSRIEFDPTPLSEMVDIDANHLAVIHRGTYSQAEPEEGDDSYVIASRISDGNIWVLDAIGHELICEMRFPDGCADVSFSGDSGEFVLAQYNNDDPVGPLLQDTLKIMRIELP
jgi:hypothetical protein